MNKIIFFFLCTSMIILINISFSNFVFSFNKLKSVILSIENEVVDLTSPLQLFDSSMFQSCAENISENDTENIVKLISEGNLSETQIYISIYLLSFSLPEKRYWEITFPLLNKIQNGKIINELLLPVPFGPGYANAYNKIPYKDTISKLKQKFINEEKSQGAINYILSGKASYDCKNFPKDPTIFNLDPSISKYLGKSWEKH